MMATAAMVSGAYAQTVPAFEQWLDEAREGERFILAEGETSPRAAPIWAAARARSEDGTVRLHHVQGNRPGWWLYIAVRRGLIEPGEPARVLRVEDDTDPAEKVLRELRRAANFDRACPSNAQLAKTCGLKDAAQASYHVKRLVQAGAIRVVAQGVGQVRVVIIVGSGRRTAQVAG